MCWGASPRWNEDLGKDIAIAQALAGLSKLGLKRLMLYGCYEKHWQAYFRDKFGAGVANAQNCCAHIVEKNAGQGLHEFIRRRFTVYQVGTESLNPWEGAADGEAADGAANPVNKLFSSRY